MNVIDTIVPYNITLEDATRIALEVFHKLPREGRFIAVVKDTVELPRELASGETLYEAHTREVYLVNVAGHLELRQWIDYKARTS